MKFRKKPVVVDAVQFLSTKQSMDEVINLIGHKWDPGEMGSESFYINTLEGKMRCSKNDWIIRGVNGEFYPCKPDIFKKTYEKIDEK
jgi:hypothetical protein